MSNEALDYLMGSGGTSASFDGAPPITHKGRVVAMKKQQQRDVKTKELKFWDNGDPMWQIVFTIDTGTIDPAIDNDDGLRNIYAKAQMLDAIRDAVRKSGHKGDLVGGTLAVRYVRDGVAKTKGFNPPKEYIAKFEPPSETDALDAFTDERGAEPVGSQPDYEYGEEPF